MGFDLVVGIVGICQVLLLQVLASQCEGNGRASGQEGGLQQGRLAHETVQFLLRDVDAFLVVGVHHEDQRVNVLEVVPPHSGLERENMAGEASSLPH